MNNNDLIIRIIDIETSRKKLRKLERTSIAYKMEIARIQTLKDSAMKVADPVTVNKSTFDRLYNA